MNKDIPYISINSLTEFVGASDLKKRRIIKDQKKVDMLKVIWYKTVKSALPKYVKSGFDITILEEAIRYLRGFDQSTNNRKSNVINSITAIESFVEMNFTKNLPNVNYHFYDKLEKKDYELNGVLVRVTPDVVFDWIEDGNRNIGAIKFHFGKSKELDVLTGRLRSSLVCDFLRKSIASKNDIVSPQYCFCVDVFHAKIFRAPNVISFDIELLKKSCKEINVLWNAV